jgi:hypothetical protein
MKNYISWEQSLAADVFPVFPLFEPLLICAHLAHSFPN